MLQTLLVLLKMTPPPIDENTPRKLMIIGTTSCINIFDDFDLKSAFTSVMSAPLLAQTEDVSTVLAELKLSVSSSELQAIAAACPLPVPIKPLLQAVEMARVGNAGQVSARSFSEALQRPVIYYLSIFFIGLQRPGA